MNAAAGALQSLFSDRIPFKHQAIAGGKGQNVRPHRLKLTVGDVDESETTLFKI